MPSKKVSVYLIDRTLAVAGEGEGLSFRLNTIAARYDELVRQAMPEFSREEWCAIFDANNGGVFPGDEDTWQRHFASAWANVHDSQGFREKWGVGEAELAQKMRDLQPAQKIALLEAIDTFWHHYEKPMDQAIALALRKPR